MEIDEICVLAMKDWFGSTNVEWMGLDSEDLFYDASFSALYSLCPRESVPAR